ncbi:MAG TPA: DUF2505 domain-containing protein [Phycicoccus sp.]|jgi:hypothetical protein|nr:DUF2505 domain-containing protein [Phycicoccus sp.]HQY96466.1 DUF2505 domain-containing protein [Phycicoccus sp.]
MEIKTHADYDASPDEVFAVISDPHFVAAKAEQMSVADHAGTVETRGDITLIASKRTLPTDDLPDIAKKFVGDVLTLLEEQEWGPPGADGSRQANLRLKIEGAPVSLRGTIALAPKGAGSTQDLVADLSAKVPLMGGTIEKASAPAIVAGIGFEVDMVKEWLAKRA